MIFGSVGLNPCIPPSRPAPLLRAPLRGVGYPKSLFGFPTIENPRIDITLNTPCRPPQSPLRVPLEGLEYP